MIALLYAACGSGCVWNWGRQPTPPVPNVFNTMPTSEQLVQAVNANTVKIRQLQTTGATITIPGLPSLTATVAMERPRRFRMRAGTRITGTELDLGSNDDLFWLWVQRNQPPAVLFCRHDQFHYSTAKQVLPIEPDWLLEAMGLVYFSPDDYHEGPYPHGAGTVEIRSVLRRPHGELTKITVIDQANAVVLEQHLFDANGQRLASSRTSEHVFDPVVQAALPRHIDIELPPADMRFAVDVGEYMINQLNANLAQLWEMPVVDGYPPIDLASRQTPSSPPAAPSLPPYGGQPYPATGTPDYNPGFNPGYTPPFSTRIGPQAALPNAGHDIYPRRR